MYRRCGRALCAVLGALIALAMTLRSVHGQEGRIRHGHRYTPPEIAARSEPLCRLLAPSARSLRLSVTPCGGASRAGGSRRWWMVDADDETGAYAAYLVWDATTQDLVLVGCPSPRPLWPVRSALNCREVIQASRMWLCKLGLCAQAPLWRSEEPAIRCGTTWFVTWRAPGRQVIVSIDSRSGHLIGAKVERVPVSVAVVRQHRA